MASYKLSVLFLVLKFDVIIIGKEYSNGGNSPKNEPDQHFLDGVHNPNYDSHAILNSLDLEDDFTKMSLIEKKKKLLDYLKLIDINNDKLIDRKELSQFVHNYYLKQDYKDTEGKMTDVDKNNDGLVDWEEYLGKVYGYTLLEMESFTNDKSQQMDYFLKMVQDDKGRFLTADENKDGFLNIKEYCAFLHPSDYPHMHDFEVNLTMKIIDKNNDGEITFDEYLGESTPGEEQKLVDYENFLSYDLDGNKKLDFNEIKLWLMPDKKSISEDESEHLLQETDSNGDGLLTFDEIADKLEVWLGSAATNYGQALTVVHDEL